MDNINHIDIEAAWRGDCEIDVADPKTLRFTFDELKTIISVVDYIRQVADVSVDEIEVENKAKFLLTAFD